MHPSPSSPGLDPLVATLLGALQGLTEFLPVSSSGHLCLAQAWLGIDPEVAGHRFNIIVHAGTLLAVLWIYRADLLRLLRSLAWRPDDALERDRLRAVVVGTLPLVCVLVFPIEAFVVAMETNVRAVGIALLVTATMLVYVGVRVQRAPSDAAVLPPTPWQALAIGLAQLVAVVPGISRSGATISMALALGVHPIEAARFSFLLAVPAILGASLKMLLELSADTGGLPQALPLLLGFATSFLVGLVALSWLIGLIARGRIAVFAPYLLALGSIAVLVGG